MDFEGASCWKSLKCHEGVKVQSLFLSGEDFNIQQNDCRSVMKIMMKMQEASQDKGKLDMHQ